MVSRDNSFIEVVGADPAAGAEVDDTLTDIEEFFAVDVTLVADATVANRDVVIQFLSPTGKVMGQVADATSITASQTVAIHVGKYAVLPTATSTNHYIQIPDNLELYPTCTIETTTANLQAGDNFGVLTRTVRQWEASNNPA
jgi:hypothetical protein